MYPALLLDGGGHFLTKIFTKKAHNKQTITINKRNINNNKKQ